MTSENMDWTLQGCCNTRQFVIIATIGITLILTAILWRTPILAPLKLVVVFLHELSHALATWITCGKVVSIEVDSNEGGATQTQGGLMCCILPAGYLGSSFWGAFFILMAAADHATHNISIRIVAGILIILCLYVLIFKAKTNLTRWILAGVIIVCIVLWLVDEFILSWHNEIMVPVLAFGTMNSTYAIYDIWDDLVARKVKQSDASKFAEITHTNARCWGVLWCMWSIMVFLLAIYFALILAEIQPN